MSKKVLEIDFQEELEFPITAFPPFKLRSSMVDTDPVIWVHLIEVYIQYVQTLLQIHQPIKERSEEQLCLFVKSYLREIGNEQGQLLSLGLINVQITENLDILRVWILELIKQYDVISLKLNGSSLWDLARIYSTKNSKLVRSIIDGTYKPKAQRTMNSISLVHKHIEHLITNGKFDNLDMKIFATLLNEKHNLSSSNSSSNSKQKKQHKTLNKNNRNGRTQSSFSESFVTIEWWELLENLYSGGQGRFASSCKDLAIISILSISTGRIASLVSELNVSSFRTLALYPLFAAIITSDKFKRLYPDLSQKLPFLKNGPNVKVKTPVNKDDVDTLIELFPNLTISQTEKLLRKNGLDVETVTNLLLENPDLVILKESSSSSRHVYQEDSKNEVFINNKNINSKSIKHVPDEHKNKTLTAALRLMYEADEDERDDTYDEAEVANSASGVLETSKTDKVEMYLWELFKKDQTVFDKTTRKSRQRKEMKNETSWSDEQIEGWAKMIQRSPKRAKLLEEKYMFRGNRPWKSSFYKGVETDVNKSTVTTPEPKENNSKNFKPEGSKSNNTQPSEYPKANSKKTQARNEKNKASRANHSRKSGHDKKMAKGY